MRCDCRGAESVRCRQAQERRYAPADSPPVIQYHVPYLVEIHNLLYKTVTYKLLCLLYVPWVALWVANGLKSAQNRIFQIARPLIDKTAKRGCLLGSDMSSKSGG